MISLDNLDSLGLEKISPALDRKKWDFPFTYDLEYLGGSYEEPVFSEKPVGIALTYGSKTGDKDPVTLRLSCTRGVLLPGAKYYTFEFDEKSAQRANQFCKKAGLPPVLGELAENPVETWQSAFRTDKCQLFKSTKGFVLVVEGDTTLIEIGIFDIPPLKGPRYAGVTIYDLQRVAKNCPKAEREDMLGYLKKPGIPVEGKTMLDRSGFTKDPSGKRWTWNNKIERRSGWFRLFLEQLDDQDGFPDKETFDRGWDLVSYAENNEDYLIDLVFADYRRCAQLDQEKLKSNSIALNHTRKEVANYMRDCALIVRRNLGSKNKPYTSVIQMRVNWEKEHGLEFTLEDKQIVAVREKPFQIHDGVLWYEGDKVTPKVATVKSAPPEMAMFAKLLKHAPVEIKKIKGPKTTTAKTKKLFAAAEKAGFKHLGWLEVTMMIPMEMAAFTSPDGSMALGMIFLFDSEEMDPEAVELFSLLTDNLKLTTTTNSTVHPQPERGIYKYSYPKASIADLVARHTEHMQQLKAEVALRINTLKDVETSVLEYIKAEHAM